MSKKHKLWDTYRFPGFNPVITVIGIFGDPKERVIGLVRRRKKQFIGPMDRFTTFFKTERSEGLETFALWTCPMIAQLVKEILDIPQGQGRLRLFFLPPYSLELNPDEYIWNELKNHHALGKMSHNTLQQMKMATFFHMGYIQKTRFL